MNVVSKINEKITALDRKVITVACTAALSLNCMAISAFASDGSTGIDMSAVTTSMTTNLLDLVSKAAIACAGVVGAGLTIFGIKWVVKTIKGFFNRIAG